MLSPQQNAKLLSDAFFNEVVEACRRIVVTDDTRAGVSSKPTDYVIDGRMITIKTKGGDYPFWIGLNGHRIFFIAYVSDVSAPVARDTYKFTFGGAAKVGWSMSAEEMAGGVSIWGTQDGLRDRPLAQIEGPDSGAASASLTSDGLFWATDIAMMVQSWVRTSERANISRHERDPAPL